MSLASSLLNGHPFILFFLCYTRRHCAKGNNQAKVVLGTSIKIAEKDCTERSNKGCANSVHPPIWPIVNYSPLGLTWSHSDNQSDHYRTVEGVSSCHLSPTHFLQNVQTLRRWGDFLNVDHSTESTDTTWIFFLNRNQYYSFIRTCTLLRAPEVHTGNTETKRHRSFHFPPPLAIYFPAISCPVFPPLKCIKTLVNLSRRLGERAPKRAICHIYLHQEISARQTKPCDGKRRGKRFVLIPTWD